MARKADTLCHGKRLDPHPARRRRAVGPDAAHLPAAQGRLRGRLRAATAARRSSASPRQRFDLVVLDLMLPKLDGIEVCRRLRARSQVPIIMLTAKGERDRQGRSASRWAPTTTSPSRSRCASSAAASGPRCGAREMVGEPTPTSEPIDARRAARSTSSARVVTLRGEDVRAHLRRVRDPRRARPLAGPRVHAARCCSSTSGATPTYRDPRTIDVHIRHLREKLESDPKEPEYLFTVRGVGYRFRE